MYITQGLHRALQRHPDTLASVCGDRRRTFREFGDRVARLAGALQQLGLKPGERVAMLALNADRYLEYQMAVPWAGGVLNPCNFRWSVAELVYSLNDCEATYLIVDDTFKTIAGPIREQAKTLRTVIFAGDGDTPEGMLGYEALIASAQPVPDALRRGSDLAGVFYTGGTTGFPKGVMLSHTNLWSSGMSVLAEDPSVRDGVYLHAAPMFHLADLGLAMAHWIQGNTHVTIPAFSPEAVIAAIERHRVTHTVLVPTMIQMLVDHPVMKAGHDLSSLRMVGYGASAISEAVLDRAMAALPNAEFMQCYGMTELSPGATINPPASHRGKGRELGRHRAAGRAIFCTEVRIVDALGDEVPRGTVGEVIVRGPNVMLGYWNKPEATADAVRDGWMHTGDGAWMDDDGYIYIADRLKDMIVSGGENVYSVEVENVVAQHPAVAACAVIGVPDDEWGERVHAVVVLKTGAEATALEITAHCKGLIAGYKSPRSVEFVQALPISGAGKVLKTELRKPFWQGRDRGVA